MPKKAKKTQVPRSGREQAAHLAAFGAHQQLDRAGAHRPRVVPNKRAQQSRKACRGRGWE